MFNNLMNNPIKRVIANEHLFLTSIRAFVLIVVINVILPWTLNQMSKSTSIIRMMWRWTQKDSFEKWNTPQRQLEFLQFLYEFEDFVEKWMQKNILE